MATRMQQRRGTAAQWTSADPVLGAGEIGFETDTGKFKMGDGATAWSDLFYFVDSSDLDLGGSLADYIPLTQKGANNGVATLDNTGKIPVAQLGNIIDGAPSTLNTLSELATAIDNDPDFYATVAGLSTAVQNNTSAITTLTTDLGNLDNTVDGNVSAISTLNTSVSNLQTQANNTDDAVESLDTLKAPKDSPSFTGTVVLPSTTSIGDVSATELGHLNGVTSAIQTQLDGKLGTSTAASTYAPLSGPSFTGTVVLPSTTSVGNVSSTEIGYLDGVTSAIQTQLDAKAPTANPTFTGTVSGVTKAHVGLGNVDNTSDANKPISTATQTALDAKASLSGATFTGSVEIDQNLVVDGNLTVNGTTFNASSTSIVIEDNLVQLAHENPANTVDLGLVVAYNDGSAKHSGIVRDVSDDRWKLFKGVTTEPTTTVNFAQGSLDDLAVDHVIANGVIFTDGEQTREGVPSRTPISQQTGAYNLSTGGLSLRDNLIEISHTGGSAVTLTIPTDATTNFPVGTSIDVLRTNTGGVTIAGAAGVTVNGTPGLTLRAQWSSATLFKRAANTWVVMGDLTA